MTQMDPAPTENNLLYHIFPCHRDRNILIKINSALSLIDLFGFFNSLNISVGNCQSVTIVHIETMNSLTFPPR